MLFLRMRILVGKFDYCYFLKVNKLYIKRWRNCTTFYKKNFLSKYKWEIMPQNNESLALICINTWQTAFAFKSTCYGLKLYYLSEYVTHS